MNATRTIAPGAPRALDRGIGCAWRSFMSRVASPEHPVAPAAIRPRGLRHIAASVLIAVAAVAIALVILNGREPYGGLPEP